MEDIYLKRLVVALGGNAILRFGEKGTVQDQLRNLLKTSAQLAPIIASWYQVAITHGNGPQVGNILIQNERVQHEIPPMPLDVCGAQSQGQLGYLLSQTLTQELKRWGKSAQVSTLLTQVVVDPCDAAFAAPSKPVGPWLSLEKMKAVRKNHETWAEDPDRGWRRMVPSPHPLHIVDSRSIQTLLTHGTTVISCGGGGVPVFERSDGSLEGVEAVIDKDLASACLAREINAHILMILTNVPGVYMDFGTPNQHLLKRVRAKELRTLLQKGAFPSGSIGPKIEAVVQFIEHGGERAVIAQLEDAETALKGKSGTSIVP
jgi:carbamate kinase